MNNKKFELTDECKKNGEIKLFRIKALIDFGNVKSGDLGGFIEKEENLSHAGDAWVAGDAYVYGDAQVYGNAWVCGNARVYGNAWVSGNTRIYGHAHVYDNAHVRGNAWVCGNARVCGNAEVRDNADYATVKGFGTVFRNTTFFRCKDKRICVSCGCFYGTINQFREQVKRTRKGKIAKEYLMITDLIEMHFGKEV